ncbi:MAG: cytochrome c3 family protein [Sedimentisphaerales bacterium]|nr:cytochrome c3 family protein [Sedimentisphaerales bacterium]
MRHLKEYFIAVVLTGTWISLAGCEETVKTDPKSVNQTLESRPGEESTLTGEKTGVEPNSQNEKTITVVKSDSSSGRVADNNLCFACHVNLKKETLTIVHAQANIGCIQCHGASEAHRLDEDTITPPDVMFPVDKVKSFCLSCHPEDSMNIPAHQAVASEINPSTKSCTDCHGEHRLKYRTRKWDKTTRNLIKDQRVRRLSDEFE